MRAYWLVPRLGVLASHWFLQAQMLKTNTSMGLSQPRFV